MQGELGSATHCIIVHWICLDGCYAYLSAVPGLGAYAVIAVHINGKVYLYHQIKQ